VPQTLVARFREGMVAANALLFLGLAVLIPPALRRHSP
jgi:hypothetical protein